jgi:hypothetical protein
VAPSAVVIVKNTTTTSIPSGAAQHKSSRTRIDFKRIQEFARENPHLARKALQPPPLRRVYNQHDFESPISTTTVVDEREQEIVNEIRKNNDNKKKKNIVSSSSSSERRTTSFEEYLKWRGWDDEYIENPMTNALLSHVLTFPLTLAANVSRLISYTNSLTPKDSVVPPVVPRRVNLCCVGSRAEANLPSEYWREFLIASNYYFIQDDKKPPKEDTMMAVKNENVVLHWNIDCIGPEVNTRSHISPKTTMITGKESELLKPKSRCISLHPDRNGPSITLNLHQEFLHRHVLDTVVHERRTNNNEIKNNVVQDALNQWDGFILFNPGIAHPNLTKSWKPSLEFIFKTQKNILVTAHSDTDEFRDRLLLKSFIMTQTKGKDEYDDSKQMSMIDNINEVFVDYRENPFASKIMFKDPFSTQDMLDEALVHPNHSVCLIAFDK